MAVLQVIIFALTLLNYAWVQAKYVPITDSNGDITGDQVGIVDGTEVSIKEAPYIAAFFRNRGDEAFGAGSIIHEQFILTSASVVKDVNFFHVLVGTDRLPAGGQLIEVDECLCHESYCEGSDSDICLLKLRIPIQLGPRAAKIHLPETDAEFESGVFVNVTGWGMMENNMYPDHLRRTMVQLQDRDTCSHLYSNVTMTDNMICAGTLHHGPCVGDGGAPLTLDDMQVGLLSFGAEHACGRFPSVFTKLSKFVSWINETISKNL